jgi:O-acetyl-ADP-ribose deacetylase (regulator of RNase III)
VPDGPPCPSVPPPAYDLTVDSDTSDAAAATFWTNPSVTAFAGDKDPIEAVTTKARNIVFAAIQSGWNGPPFDPIALARALGMQVMARDDLSDARVVSLEDGRLRIEFNPTRPRGRLRFSIAHEVAHTFFSDVAADVRHRTGTGAVAGSAVGDEWQLELLCNVAAGELLVPSLALPTGELDSAALDINRLMAIRSRFDVSTEAILRRTAQATTHAVTMFAAAAVGDEEDGSTFRIDYTVPSIAWGAEIRRGSTIHSEVLAECTAVGFTAVGVESWSEQCEDVAVSAVGLPPYPGDRLPRVAGLLVRDLQGATSETISYITGDATQPRGSGTRIIAHVVNDQARAWGGHGFAVQLRRAQPQAAEAFHYWTIARPENLRLGHIHVVELSDGLSVASMVAQEGYGDSADPRLRYDALTDCLDELRLAALRLGASVHMPRIGLGQGGGTWALIAEEIEGALCRHGVSVTVYTLPGEHEDLVLEGARPAS